jgi:uncharacterized protein
MPGKIFNTALCYENGDGIEQNYLQAAAWYTEAVNQNHAPAINNLAVLYENGFGVSKKPKLALRLFQQSANLGHPAANKNAERLEAELAEQES